MTEISHAIAAKKAEIKKLQTDIAALHRATSIIGVSAKSGKKQRTTAKPTRRKMSAAARKALSKKLKAYWAAKKKST